jgi:hypothetical protein
MNGGLDRSSDDLILVPELDPGRAWPVALVIVGIALVAAAFLRRDERRGGIVP